MKNFFKILKIVTKKEASLFIALRDSLRDDFSLDITAYNFNGLLKQRKIKVMGREVQESEVTLHKGTKLTVSLTKTQFREWSLPVVPSFEIDPSMIIHDENIFLIGNKPSGVSSNATINSTKDNFLAAMTRYLTGKYKEKYLALHHRIDFETSGLLLFCKKKSYNKYFTDLFENKLIKKTYLVLVEDQDNSFADIVVTNLLDRDQKDRMRMKSVTSGGKSAKTSFKVLAHSKGLTLISASPETGRFHQIRIHLSELGYPIIGDTLYGGPDAKRIFLHAYILSFLHPETKKMITFTAPIPKDFPEDIINLVK